MPYLSLCIDLTISKNEIKSNFEIHKKLNCHCVNAGFYEKMKKLSIDLVFHSNFSILQYLH